MKEKVTLKDPRTCRIFFSSPFGGMEEEREELTKKFFPQIHHACNAKGVKFVPVDMRWGITKEAAENAQVMNICLREVERSDFFVGFFGQRYGWHSAHTSSDVILKQNFDNAIMFYPWVDELRNRSMTEIEWRAGHLNNPGAMPTCFCFRDKEFDYAMAKEAEEAGKPYQKAKFTCENEYAAGRLQALTDEILATQDKTYGIMVDYKTPQEGAKFIFDKIWHFVTEVALKDVSEEETPHLLKLRQVHDQFAKSKTHLYCGCQQYFEVLNEKLFESSCEGILVSGPAGCGKSSFLASWVQSLQSKHPHLPVIYHFIGCAPGTERPKAILERLVLELKSAFPAYGHKSPEPGRGTPRTHDKDDDTTTNSKSNGDEKGSSAPETSNKTVIMESSEDGKVGVGDSSRIPSHDENSNKTDAEDRNSGPIEDKDSNNKFYSNGSTSSSLPVTGTMDASLKIGENGATDVDQKISKQEINSEVLVTPHGADKGALGQDLSAPVEEIKEEVLLRQAMQVRNVPVRMTQARQMVVDDSRFDLKANQAMHVSNDTSNKGPGSEMEQSLQAGEFQLDLLANQAMHVSNDTSNIQPEEFRFDLLANQAMHVSNDTSNIQPEEFRFDLLANQAMHVSNDTSNIQPEEFRFDLLANQAMHISNDTSNIQPEEFRFDLLANQAMHVSNDTNNKGPGLEKKQIIQPEEFQFDLLANQAMYVTSDTSNKGPGSEKEQNIQSGDFRFDLLANQAMHVTNDTSNKGPPLEKEQIIQSEKFKSDSVTNQGMDACKPDQMGEGHRSEKAQIVDSEESKSDSQKNQVMPSLSDTNNDENALNKDQNVAGEERKVGSVLDNNNQDISKKEKESKAADAEETKDTKSPEQKKTSQQLLNEVNDLLKSISENGEKVIIVIDALNQQQKFEKTTKHLYWLPEVFPKDVCFICSSLNSDKASYDLLVLERKMYAMSIEPYNSELQLEICVESLKVSGKELSPHQLDRIVSSNETTNPLFLKLIIYELSIYGSFRKLDEKIDSLIYVNGVRPLLQVILSRLEEDYNSKEYHGNLVKDVLCCLIASKKGVSESEIVKILSIPSNLWSPLFFALEYLLVQYTGLLGFAFTEMYDAVKERYLNDPSNIIFYKKLLIDFFDGTRQTMKPWTKNSGLEYTRVMDELPWLQHDIGEKKSLINTLSDISIMKKMINSNGNDLLELWQSTGLTWSAVTSLYMKAFDSALVNLYEEQQEGVLEAVDSPGSMLRVSLQNLRMFFDIAYYPPGNEQAMKREINILENCRSKYTPEKKAEYLRDSRYYLAVAYSDRQNYEDALPLYFSIMEECERILKDKEDSAAEELLAFTSNGLGLVYYGKQDYPKALEYLQRSEGMHKKRNEKRHQAASATNIGLVYINQRLYKKALESFGEAMQLYNDHFFGEMPLDVGNLLTNIALTYRRMKDLDKAEEYYHKSLEMKAKNVGWYHPVIAVAFMNLGTLEVHRKNFAKGEEWTRKAIHIYELNEVPVTDKSLRMCRENLCMNMMKQNKKEELLPLYFEVTNILMDNGWIGECIVPLHRDMIDFIMDRTDIPQKNEKLEKILLAILSSPKRRACFAYQLATLDSNRPAHRRPKRPDDLTIQHFIEEFPRDSKLQILYVTDCLAKEDKYEDILSICMALHDKERDLKESAFSFAADALIESSFHQSAKKILLLGLEKYPGHMELVNCLIPCLIALKEANDLIPYIPAMLETSDWELLNENNLLACGTAMESIDVDLAVKCYTKLIQDGSRSARSKAERAKMRLLMDNKSPEEIDG